MTDGVGTIGITNFAQDQLGDVVFVDLPELGSTVEKDDTMGAVESVKAASDIYSPVSGEVVAVNEALVDEPALVNTSAEADGWMAKVKLSDESELDGLMVRAATAATASAQTAPSMYSLASFTVPLAFLRPSTSTEASPPIHGHVFADRRRMRLATRSSAPSEHRARRCTYNGLRYVVRCRKLVDCARARASLDGFTCNGRAGVPRPAVLRFDTCARLGSGRRSNRCQGWGRGGVRV